MAIFKAGWDEPVQNESVRSGDTRSSHASGIASARTRTFSHAGWQSSGFEGLDPGEWVAT